MAFDAGLDKALVLIYKETAVLAKLQVGGKLNKHCCRDERRKATGTGARRTR